jgi:sugar lactone lactonase YvrE
MSGLHVLLEGVAFGESPRWHDGRLWFSDWGAQEIVAVDEQGNRELIIRVEFPAFPMCIDFAADDALLLVAGRDGQIWRREPEGSLGRYADLGHLSPSPWNDMGLDGTGNAYGVADRLTVRPARFGAYPQPDGRFRGRSRPGDESVEGAAFGARPAAPSD